VRVALLAFDFGEYCVRLASALASETSVLLLLPEDQYAPHASRLDRSVRVYTFSKARLRQPIRQLRMTASLVRALRHFDPHVIHLQQGHLWFNCALPLLRRYSLVLTIHDHRQHLGDKGAHKTPTPITNFGFHRADRLIVHAEALRSMVVGDRRISPASVHVIPHIVLGDAGAYAHVPEDDHLVLFFGRIWPYKGLDYLIRAEPLITALEPRAKIMIAGEGEDFARYRRMMVHPDNFIVRNEYVPDDTRSELFRRASIVVLPYIEASQSGVVPLAYTFGKPVVATTVGGLPEIVADGVTGYLVPPRDERALADAIVRLLRDSDLRHEQGRNAKRRIETECSPEQVARQTLEVYRLALRSPARQPRPLDSSGVTDPQ
jgi:glycosyltransferase involved in cell wall biosynthesis